MIKTEKKRENVIEKQEPEKKRRLWLIIISILLALVVFGFFFIGFIAVLIAGTGNAETGNVAVIPVKGVIMIDKEDSFFATGIASATTIVALIEEAEKDASIQAIVFDINSPGGAPVASAEISSAIKEATKPTVAVIREVGASGAYWAASASDYIIANEVSITGSIGVLASYLQYGGLLERYNVSYERFTAGKYKDMGTPYREMSEEEKKLYQRELDMMHDIFIREVADNRGLDYDYTASLATGQIYLGVEAVDLGLVDELGGKREAYTYIENEFGIVAEPVEFEEEKSFFELLASALDNTAFQVGTGIGATLVNSESGIMLKAE